MQVNKAQGQAIAHKDGPAMVLAGPGSGKTTVLTHRIHHMIQVHGIRPEHILVITFSKAAATEMKERFQKLAGPACAGVTFGTFHAVFFHILKRAYGYSANNIIRDDLKLRFMREFVQRMRLEYDEEEEFVTSVLSEISKVKNMAVDLADYEAVSCSSDIFSTLFSSYTEFLKQNRYIDFDDMLVYTKELFLERPDILSAWQEKFRYILIDEFQDINQLQYDIVQLLAAPRRNLFIVGDDDQSIYGFRGAQPGIMLHFEEDYPDAVRILLDINYRSGVEIVRLAGNVISHNKLRFDKDIRAHAKDGLSPVLSHFETQQKQNEFVLATIEKLHKEEGLPFKEIAVLYRTNAQPALLLQQLISKNLPFSLKESIPNIYEHWMAKDLFAYIQLAMGDRSRASFLRVMNRPRRYLSRESLPYDSVNFDLWKAYYKTQPQIVKNITKFEADLNLLSRLRPFSALNYIFKAMGYEGYLKEISAAKPGQKEELLDVFNQLLSLSRPFPTYKAWFEAVKEAELAWEEAKKNKDTSFDGIRLCTLHTSKGLEFDTVFLVDVDEGLMPYQKAELAEEIEEERRMFYVGMTRAKTRLYLLSSGQIHNKEKKPSRFLKECEAVEEK